MCRYELETNTIFIHLHTLTYTHLLLPFPRHQIYMKYYTPSSSSSYQPTMFSLLKRLSPYSFYVLYCCHIFHPLRLPTIIVVCPLVMSSRCFGHLLYPALERNTWGGEARGSWRGSLVLTWRATEFSLPWLPNRFLYSHAEVLVRFLAQSGGMDSPPAFPTTDGSLDTPLHTTKPKQCHLIRN